jgi:hypothetical protein
MSKLIPYKNSLYVEFVLKENREYVKKINSVPAL